MENVILNWIHELCKYQLKVSEISFNDLSIIDLFYVYIEVYAKYGIILPLENGNFLNSSTGLAKYIADNCDKQRSEIRSRE